MRPRTSEEIVAQWLADIRDHVNNANTGKCRRCNVPDCATWRYASAMLAARDEMGGVTPFSDAS